MNTESPLLVVDEPVEFEREKTLGVQNFWEIVGHLKQFREYISI